MTMLEMLAAIALLLAAWRSHTAWRQAQTAEQNLLNRQFQSAVEMLGHEIMTVRLGGVTTLSEIARRNSKQYHVRVMEVFIAFLSYPPRHTGGMNAGGVHFDSADTREIVKEIEQRTSNQISIEQEQGLNVEQRLQYTYFPLHNGKITFLHRAGSDTSEKWRSFSSPTPPPPPPS